MGFNDRTLLKQLSHAGDKLSQADDAIEKKEYALVKVHIKTSYGLIKRALENEKIRKRNDGKKFNVSKRKILKQHIKMLKEDLVIIRMDIRHNNKASAYNGIKNMRTTIRKIKRGELKSYRKEDNE